MKIVQVPTASILPNPENPRFITAEQFDKLKQSMLDFPEMQRLRPIVIDESRTALGGNMRLKAAEAIGQENVWVIQITDLTPEQKQEFVIKDNVGYGEWDWDTLANIWSKEDLNEWGLITPEEYYPEEEEETEFEDGYEIPEEVETNIQDFDLIEIGRHRLVCGDSTKQKYVTKLMDGKEADLVMTDPPYNVNYTGGTGLTIMNDKQTNSQFFQFLLDFYNEFKDVTKAGGAWYVWHADTEGYNFRRAFEESGLLLKQCLVWVKNALVMGRQDYQWKHEPCLYGWKEGAAHYFVKDRTNTTVIEEPEIDLTKLKKQELIEKLEQILQNSQTTILRHDKPRKSAEHPTMKPILLLAPLIRNSSKPNEIVADPFIGSGSTMVASHQIGRICYGMELDPKYCQVVIDRMTALDPSLEVKINGIKITQ